MCLTRTSRYQGHEVELITTSSSNTGRGNGSGNFPQQPTWFGSSGAGSQQPTRPPNPYKHWENWNYCLTHGGDVEDWHTSATCGYWRLAHNPNATRANIMDGLVAGMHKTILPSARGHTPPPSRLPQQQQRPEPRPTPSHNYAHAASALLRTITTNAATIKQLGILNSGATSHFLTTNAPASNIIPASVPLIACLPNNDRVQSMHTCTLDLPDLPTSARAAHIIPGLASHSLLSVVTMCNAGCMVTFAKINCTIIPGPHNHLWPQVYPHRTMDDTP